MNDDQEAGDSIWRASAHTVLDRRCVCKGVLGTGHEVEICNLHVETGIGGGLHNNKRSINLLVPPP